jgi:predicted kinase
LSDYYHIVMNDQKVIIMVGCPASGKSTFAKQYVADHKDTFYLGSDELRGYMGESESDQTVSNEVFAYIKDCLDYTLKYSTLSVLIDACHVTVKARKDYHQIAKRYDASMIAYVFDRTHDILLERNRVRGANGGTYVPDWVIDRMYRAFTPPSIFQGFDEIVYIK